MRKIFSLILAAGCLAAACGLASCGTASGGRTQYDIKGEYHAQERLFTAEMTADIRNPLGRETDELKFQLWPNAYRAEAKFRPVSELFASSAYYDGESYGEIEIKGITGAKSFEICGEDENILSVKLASPLKAGGRASIGISFEVELAKIEHRLGVAACAVNLANFYPILCAAKDGEFCEYVYCPNGDPFVSETADYDVTITLPSSYTLATGFAAEEGEEIEGKRAYHVRAEGVRDVAFVFAEGMKCVTAEEGGVEVAYYYASDRDPQRTLEAAAKSLAYFSETFGAYAYPRYAVAETGFVYGGMEYPALSMIANDLSEAELPAVVAHETAHQWWYAMVGSDQYGSAWQDEGLAEFSAALFLGEHPEYATTYRDFVNACERSYRAYFSVTSQLNGETDTTMSRPLPSFSGEYEYRNLVYDKGVILFDRVREVMGERKFFQALRRYCDEYCGKIAAEDDLIRCFERSSGGIGDLFASFLEGRCVI